MELTVQIPDDVAQRLNAGRRGLETGDQIDTFLKAHDVWIDYTIEDVQRERAGLRRLGF